MRSLTAFLRRGGSAAAIVCATRDDTLKAADGTPAQHAGISLRPIGPALRARRLLGLPAQLLAIFAYAVVPAATVTFATTTPTMAMLCTSDFEDDDLLDDWGDAYANATYCSSYTVFIEDVELDVTPASGWFVPDWFSDPLVHEDNSTEYVLDITYYKVVCPEDGGDCVEVRAHFEGVAGGFGGSVTLSQTASFCKVFYVPNEIESGVWGSPDLWGAACGDREDNGNTIAYHTASFSFGTDSAWTMTTSCPIWGTPGVDPCFLYEYGTSPEGKRYHADYTLCEWGNLSNCVQIQAHLNFESDGDGGVEDAGGSWFYVRCMAGAECFI